jgi:hypothetical protein
MILMSELEALVVMGVVAGALGFLWGRVTGVREYQEQNGHRGVPRLADSVERTLAELRHHV